jgi:hypothetical protein
MSPEMVQLDDMPDGDPGDLGADGDGKVACPECDLRFMPTGIKRHITMTHRGGVSDGPSDPKTPKGTKSPVLATRWKDFQLGAALLVSLACADCAKALSEDAEKDGEALAAFCISRPKLRKQIEQFLATADFMLLVGAFGGTAQKMISHHSIAKKMPLGMVKPTNAEHGAHDPMQRMASFMSSMPEEQRHKIFDQALGQYAKVTEAKPPAAAPEPVPFEHVPAEKIAEQVVEATPVAGGEPAPEVHLSDRDKDLINAMHADAAFSANAGSSNLG